MHLSYRPLAVALTSAAALALASCGSSTTPAGSGSSPTASSSSVASSSSATGSGSATTTGSSSDDEMAHAMDGGPAPAGMKPATNAKYPVGTKVILQAGHMPGMKGAPGTVVGVYNTTTYAVTYTPTTGGAPVVNHKWVVQEELEGVGTQKVADGTPVTITADHMSGMKGAKGTVVSSTTEPVYQVDYEHGGMTMKNHKWMVESELAPAS